MSITRFRSRVDRGTAPTLNSMTGSSARWSRRTAPPKSARYGGITLNLAPTRLGDGEHRAHLFLVERRGREADPVGFGDPRVAER